MSVLSQEAPCHMLPGLTAPWLSMDLHAMQQRSDPKPDPADMQRAMEALKVCSPDKGPEASCLNRAWEVLQ